MMQPTTTPNESNTPGSVLETNDSRLLEPTDKDIVFGRGKKFQDHEGNRRMRECINAYKQLYNALKRFQKQALVETIYDKLVEGGARFLRKDEANDTWVLVERELATQKVSHALRCKKHLVKPSSPKKIQESKKKSMSSLSRKDSNSSTIDTRDSAPRSEMATADSSSTPTSSEAGGVTPAIESFLSSKTVTPQSTLPMVRPNTVPTASSIPGVSIANLQVLQTLRIQDMLYQQQMLAMMNLQQQQAQQQAYYNAAVSQLLGIRKSAE